MHQTRRPPTSHTPNASGFATVDELQQRIEELERENRSKADFLALLSHELRTPLNAVIGYAELLLSGIPQGVAPQARAHIERIHSSAVHQSKLVNEIVRYARLESGAEPIVHETVALHSVLEEVVSLTLPAATQKGLQVEIRGESAVTVQTDATRLRQILINLLSNAIKFSEDGTITVKTVASAEFLTIEVSDDGIGIDETMLERVFEPFWRAKKSSEPEEGVGLGLAVSHALARSLGGDLTVRSELGVGSAFTLRLPAEGRLF